MILLDWGGHGIGQAGIVCRAGRGHFIFYTVIERTMNNKLDDYYNRNYPIYSHHDTIQRLVDANDKKIKRYKAMLLIGGILISLALLIISSAGRGLITLEETNNDTLFQVESLRALHQQHIIQLCEMVVEAGYAEVGYDEGSYNIIDCVDSFVRDMNGLIEDIRRSQSREGEEFISEEFINGRQHNI